MAKYSFKISAWLQGRKLQVKVSQAMTFYSTHFTDERDKVIFIALGACYWTQIKPSKYQSQREGRIHTNLQKLKFVQIAPQNRKKEKNNLLVEETS